MKTLRIEPLYLFPAFVACLPFLAVWLSRTPNESEPAFRTVRLDWMLVELPGQVVEARAMDPGGMHYITAGNAWRMAVVALVPAPDGSPIRSAAAKGAPAVARLYRTLFPSENLQDLDARLVAQEEAYHLTGRRPSDGWHVAGRVRLLPVRPFALVLLVAAPTAGDARTTADRIFRSVAIQAPDAAAAPPSDD